MDGRQHAGREARRSRDQAPIRRSRFKRASGAKALAEAASAAGFWRETPTANSLNVVANLPTSRKASRPGPIAHRHRTASGTRLRT
jgi:hypothetical protein